MQKEGMTGKHEQTYNGRLIPDAVPSPLYKNADDAVLYTGMGGLLRNGEALN